MSRLPAGPVLVLVTDRHRSRLPLADAVPRAIHGGVDLCLVREPDLPDGEVAALVSDLIAVAGRERLLVSGRPAVAGQLGVGLHLRDGDQLTCDRRTWPLVGRAVHGPIVAGAPDGTDYLLAGNVYPTRTHPGREGRGTTWLGDVVATAATPVIGVGGITPANAGAAMATGCRGVAVIDAILDADDPEAAAATLRRVIDRATTKETSRQ